MSDDEKVIVKKSVLKIIKALLIVVNIVIALIFVSVIYPLVTDQIRIIPSDQPLKYNISGYNLTATAPIHIINKGIYPFTNIKISYFIFNNTTLFSRGSEKLPNVVGDYNQSVTFKIDLLNIYNTERTTAFYLLFHYSTLNLTMLMSGEYAMSLVSFKVNVNTPVNWDPPIEEFNVSHNYSINSTNTSTTLSVPYFIKTANYLSGNMKMNTDLYVNNTYITSSNATIPLGTSFSSYYNFIISKSDEFLLNNLKYIILKNTISLIGLSFSFTLSNGGG